MQGFVFVARYQSPAPSYNPGQYVPVLTDVAGRIIVSGSSPTPAPPSSWSTVADVVPPHGALGGAIVGVATPVALGVQLKADSGNTDYVLVTFSAAIGLGGIRLGGGESFFVDIDDAAKVFVWSPSAAQAVEIALL